MKPPNDSWDGLAWLRFLHGWKDEWPEPHGMSFDAFHHKLVLSLVPDGWIKPGYGPTAGERGRGDIGAGHAAFLTLFIAGAFDSLPAGKGVNFGPFVASVANAICAKDTKFFPDFGQAFQTLHDLPSGEKLLFAATRRNEFMVLAVMLADLKSTYRTSQLRRDVEARFGNKVMDDKAVDKVIARWK